MTESALVLPTSVVRNNVSDFVGSFYSFLHSYYWVFLIIIALVVSFFLIRLLKNLALKLRSRKNIPESTNEWFSWEDFKKWQESQERQKG